VAVADVLPRVIEAARQIQGGGGAETGTRGKAGAPSAPEPAAALVKSPAAKGGRDRFAARQLDLFEETGRSGETAPRGMAKPSRPAVAAVPPARSTRVTPRPAPKTAAVKRAAPASKAKAPKRAAPARTAKRSKTAVRSPARKKAPSRTKPGAPAKRRGPASKRRR
jgi:histone H1/5